MCLHPTDTHYGRHSLGLYRLFVQGVFLVTTFANAASGIFNVVQLVLGKIGGSIHVKNQIDKFKLWLIYTPCKIHHDRRAWAIRNKTRDYHQGIELQPFYYSDEPRLALLAKGSGAAIIPSLSGIESSSNFASSASKLSSSPRRRSSDIRASVVSSPHMLFK